MPFSVACLALFSAFVSPVSVTVEGDGFTNALVRSTSWWRSGETWSVGDITVRLASDGAVSLASPAKGVSAVRLDWEKTWPADTTMLADAWERSYGALGWQSIDTERISPWYFLVTADGRTDGYGVKVQPNALACWKVRSGGYTLRLDVRAGGRPVRLGGRTLDMATIVTRVGKANESAFEAGRALCRVMCEKPLLPKEPVYGYNDWYCAYGRNTATNFLADAAYIVECAKGLENRPYVVMDDGWQKNSPPVVKVDSGHGPWDRSGEPFGMDMKTFAAKVAALGARPGLWYRPFRAWKEMPADWKLLSDERYVDPTVPAVREQIRTDMTRFREWGFKLVKIDYLTYDICLNWSSSQGDRLITDTREWRDSSRTTVEVLKDLYGVMREAAGDNVIIIGCNALNHLAAGRFELQRIGDDTSGRDWARTRKMGVNTLAFRSVQDQTFFAADADCVGLAAPGAVPWELNRQWLDLVARSGTPLFVSWHRRLATPEFKSALSRAYAIASKPRATGEPLDWTDGAAPKRWRFADGEADYDWTMKVYADPKAEAKVADGTDLHPFPTLEAAVGAAVKRRAKHPDEAIDVVLADGDYPVPKVIQLCSAEGFKSSLTAPFTVCAAKGARPRLLGSVPVTGWKKTTLNGRGDVWETDLSSLKLKKRLDLFFLDGTSMTMCRYPNRDAARPYSGGWAYVDGTPFGMYKTSTNDNPGVMLLRPADRRAWSDPSEGRVNIFPRYNWWNAILGISCVSNGYIVFTKPLGQQFPPRPLDRYHVMGLREELDAPGEWYHDLKGEKLYFIPPAGIDPNSKVTSVPVSGSVFCLRGVTNVVFRGLEICSAAAGVNTSWRRVNRCRVEDCHIHDVGFMHDAGVSLSGTENTVTDCDIWNIGGYGINLSCGWDAPPHAPADRDGNLAFNNYIHHTGLINRHGFGIYIGGQGSRVAHNLIHDMPRGGIFYTGRFLTIDHNRIRHCNTEMEDTAAIYGGGYCSNVGTKINYNHVSDSIGFSHNAKGEYLFFNTCAWGIYLDDCSGGAEVVGNLVENCNRGGMHMHCARFNVVSNNVFVSNGGPSANTSQHSINGWTKKPTDKGWPGTMSESTQKSYERFVGPYPEWKKFTPLAFSPKDVPAPDGLIMQGNRIVNNIWYYPDEPDTYAKQPGRYNVKNNLFDRNIYWPGKGEYKMKHEYRDIALEDWRKLGQDVHTIVADPLFADAAKGDYAFRSGSPAEKLGIWQLPVREMGLVLTKFRTGFPVEAEGLREHPEWLKQK